MNHFQHLYCIFCFFQVKAKRSKQYPTVQSKCAQYLQYTEIIVFWPHENFLTSVVIHISHVFKKSKYLVFWQIVLVFFFMDFLIKDGCNNWIDTFSWNRISCISFYVYFTEDVQWVSCFRWWYTQFLFLDFFEIKVKIDWAFLHYLQSQYDEFIRIFE